MNELDLIALLTQSLPRDASVIVGVGDDCAVLEAGIAGERLLFKTDAVVEGVHFLPGTAPEKIGHKALARCLSDIAAMGGTPTHAVITLALPVGFDVAQVRGIYGGMTALAAKHQVAIVGGETTTNPERLLISIALLGKVAANRCVLRSGSQPGDAIFVTGELGGSLSGRHLDFEPRLAEAQWLAEHFDVHGMIDVSDGLASDLRHLLQASKVGGELLAKAVPISRSAKERARSDFLDGNPDKGGGSTKSPLLAALTDGEDFELLFTVSGRDAVPLVDAWKEKFPALRLSCIGKTTSEPGLTIRDGKGTRSVTEHGYIHFA